jgi:RNA polymerase sigma-70 factor (ECF subfamily)
VSYAHLLPRYLTRSQLPDIRHEAGPRTRAVAGEPVVTHPDDLALVRDALAGRSDAIEALGERLKCIGPMTRARRRVVAPWLPDTDLPDLEQEVATKVIERLPRYSGLAALESWVFAFCDGVVRNAGRRHFRNQARQQDLTAADALAAGDGRSERGDSDRHEDLHACLEGLGQAERDMVRTKHFDGLQLNELAAALGAGLNTIKSRYFRALQKLRLCLERKHGGQP